MFSLIKHMLSHKGGTRRRAASLHWAAGLRVGLLLHHCQAQALLARLCAFARKALHGAELHHCIGLQVCVWAFFYIIVMHKRIWRTCVRSQNRRCMAQSCIDAFALGFALGASFYIMSSTSASGALVCVRKKGGALQIAGTE